MSPQSENVDLASFDFGKVIQSVFKCKSRFGDDFLDKMSAYEQPTNILFIVRIIKCGAFA